MSKKSTSKVNIQALSYLKVVFCCILFSILVANCGSNGTGKGEKVDWLHHWKPILFTANHDDSVKINKIKKKIRVHVRGWLADYNDSVRANYIVEEFIFDRKSISPLEYTVKAFLNPPARHHGVHLIPQEPPPPD